MGWHFLHPLYSCRLRRCLRVQAAGDGMGDQRPALLGQQLQQTPLRRHQRIEPPRLPVQVIGDGPLPGERREGNAHICKRMTVHMRYPHADGLGSHEVFATLAHPEQEAIIDAYGHDLCHCGRNNPRFCNAKFSCISAIPQQQDIPVLCIKGIMVGFHKHWPFNLSAKILHGQVRGGLGVGRIALCRRRYVSLHCLGEIFETLLTPARRDILAKSHPTIPRGNRAVLFHRKAARIPRARLIAPPPAPISAAGRQRSCRWPVVTPSSCSRSSIRVPVSSCASPASGAAPADTVPVAAGAASTRGRAGRPRWAVAM